MAVTQVKRSIHKTQLAQAARRNDRRATTRHPERGKPAERRTQSRSSSNRSTAPGSFALVERKLPCRRFVEFPQVNGKTIKQIHFYTATDYHSITIDFKDQTCLNLEIE